MRQALDERSTTSMTRGLFTATGIRLSTIMNPVRAQTWLDGRRTLTVTYDGVDPAGDDNSSQPAASPTTLAVHVPGPVVLLMIWVTGGLMVCPSSRKISRSGETCRKCGVALRA